ncbi:uncharacterized protein [Amphiura filiformis]|uniref:uncharacterized protein isoform X2 n=1 Tax=Amphiura filiformis TaxID=82378 RepID=UPI003B20E903
MRLYIILVCSLLLGSEFCHCKDSKLDQLVYFEPMTEYVFQLTTDADMKSTRIDSSAKIGLILVRDLANGQEIYLDIHHLDTTSAGRKVMIHEENNIARWFSFKIRPNGRVFEVVYPVNEDQDVITLKKSITAMFSGHLNVTRPMADKTWQYYSEETGTEGLHHSSYTASKSKEGVIFKKVRLTHHVSSGHAVHEKEIHFNSYHTIPTQITINEHFRAPTSAPSDDENQMKEDDDDQQVFPEMSVASESEIIFLYSQEKYTPECREKNLTSDTLHIKSVGTNMNGFNETMMWNFINGNLSCIKEKEAKESLTDLHCFQDLVGVLREVPESHIQNIINIYLSTNGTKLYRHSMDKIIILDALLATRLVFVQDIITNTVFLSPAPDKYLVERFLMLSISNNETISKLFVKTLQKFVNQPSMFPAALDDQTLHRTAVMALGGIASHFTKLGKFTEATDLVTGIENKLGIHDPWDYNKVLSTMSSDDQEHHNLNTAAMVEALGNAGLDQSFEHIVSYTNSTDTPHILRRSGLHSLRNYGSQKVAHMLLDASQNDVSKQVRNFAATLYQEHPYGESVNKSESESNRSETEKRLRRDLGDLTSGLIPEGGWEFSLPIEPVHVTKRTGNRFAGGYYGYDLINSLTLKVGLLNAIMEIEANNRAFAGFHVFEHGVKLLTADQCFNGAIEIRINPFKEVKCAIVQQFLTAFDRLIKHYINVLNERIEDFFDWILDVVNSVLDDFLESLELIRQTIHDAIDILKSAQERLSRLNPNFLKFDALSSVLRVMQKAHDLLLDLKDLHYKASEAVDVILPAAFEQLTKAIEFFGNNINLANIVTAPHVAIENTYKALIDTDTATNAILNVRQTLEETGVLGDELNPTWTRLPDTIGELLGDLEGFKVEFFKSIDSAMSGNSEMNSKQSQNVHERLRSDVLEVLDDLVGSLTQMRYVTSPLQTVAKRFSDSTKVLKRLFMNLRNSYLDTKQQIVTLLGPNVHHDFPSAIRLAGSGCNSNGFYPTTADSFYSDQGVDLVTEPSQKIVAPFSGAVSRSSDTSIRLVPKDGGFINTVIYIDNLIPAEIIPLDDFIFVVAGTILGASGNNGPCGSRHIHFVVKSEIDPKPFDTRDKRSVNEGEGLMEPTPYLNDRVLEIGAYKRGCDDITIKLVGMTIGRGRLTQPLKKVETPHKHEVDLGRSLNQERRELPNLHQPGETSSWFTEIHHTDILDNLGISLPAFGKPYTTNFNSNSVKVGNLLSFFEDVGLNDNVEEVINSLGNLAIQIADTPCVNPHSLTDRQLVQELYKRGRSITGSRIDLIRRFRSPDDRCPLLQVSIPKNSFCNIDQSCLALECCLNIPLLTNQISLKAFVRYEPCLSEVIIGLWDWKLNIEVTEYDVEDEIYYNINFKGIGQQKILLRYKLEKADQLLLVSLSFGICSDGKGCMPFYNVFTESAFMMPNCYNNVIQSWDAVDISGYFQRESLVNFIHESGQVRGDFTPLRVAETLNISTSVISDLPKCRRPDELRTEELREALRSYGKHVSGTRQELLGQLISVQEKCDIISISQFTASVADMMYCFISPTCQRVECCLTVHVDGYKPSFRLFMELRSCDLSFAVGFEEAVVDGKLGDIPENGHVNEKQIGWITLQYAIRNSYNDGYSFNLNVLVCPDQSNCVMNVSVLEDQVFSISPCTTSDFTTPDSSREGMTMLEGFQPNYYSTMHEEAVGFWRNRIVNNNTTFTVEENMNSKISSYQDGTNDKKEEQLLAGTSTGMIPLQYLLEEYANDSSRLGFTNTLRLPLEDEDSTKWPGINVIGGALTENGAAVITQYVLERTLPEIGLLLETQGISQLTSINRTIPRVFKRTTHQESESDIWATLYGELQNELKTWVQEHFPDYIYVKPSEEYVARDFIISVSLRLPPRGRFYIYPLQVVVPIPIGIAVIEFGIRIGAGISIEVPFKLAVGTMTYKVGITPGVAVAGEASAAVGIFFFRLGFVVVIEILGTDYPISREVNYCKFPVEVTDRVDVVLTPLVVRMYIKAWIKVWIFRKTLFSKELWSWSAPSFRGNIYLNEYTKKDDTIPKLFDSIVDKIIDGKRSLQEVLPPAETKSCLVQHVLGLDYTEASVYLQVAAGDDVSYVTYTLSVGTEPGGSEVIKDQLFAGPSAIISEHLPNGVPLYFTVRAKNSQGGYATATCTLPTFDTTLPGGRLDVAFRSTSHPGVLKASAVIYDDSEIMIKKTSTGFGVGLYGDQSVPWQFIDSSERQSSGAIIGKNEFDQFTAPKIGRLVSKPIITITYQNPNLCARDCLNLPRSKCISFNYDYGNSKTCELLEEIQGHGVTLHRSGFYSHFERLGIGHAVAIYHENLQLQHNNLYYFNIHVTNILGYDNILSSSGVLADFVPPEPGIIVNAASDQTIWEQCSKYTPEEWQGRCVSDTPLPNHRTIIDGEGSQTVFNGHTPFKDLLFTKANEYISANWDGFHDNETGIFGYTWSVGSSICGDDISAHMDPHSHLFDESEWNHNGIVDGVYLEDGQYFITVRAINKVEFGGPMAVTVCHTTPYTIDTSPPIIHDISNITYALGRIGVTTSCSDPESGVRRSDFALGVTPRDTYILSWQLYPYKEFIEVNFKIPDGIPAWVQIRCVNNVHLATTGHSDTSLLVDSTPPVKGILNDGSKPGVDEEFFKDNRNICSNWQNFHDTDSGIASYLWAIGSYPGGVDVVDFVQLEYDTNIYCAGNLTLEHGKMYFATLVAIHGGIEMLNVTGSSNGVTLDITPPVSGYIMDGQIENGIDMEYSSQPASVAAFWDDFYDPESSVAEYIVSVNRQTSSNGTHRSETIHQPESISKVQKSVEWHHFNLLHNDFIHVNLRTINGAGNHIDVESNGYRVDLTPPVLEALGDGPDINVDIEYQTYTDRISVHWNYEDLESGIIYYQMAIYELKHGNKRKIYPADLDDNNFMHIEDISATGHTQESLQLKPGYIYTSLIKAVNGAQLVASHETTGVRIDPSPPKMEYVRAGSVDGDIEELLHGYVYQSDRFGIKASWRGRDPESKIMSYWVAVGSDLYSSDIREFRSEGQGSAGYISDLNLNLTNNNECENNCQPVYYVCVKAQNGAGEYSDVVCSSPIKVVAADNTGYVMDGPQQSLTDGDVDAQIEANAVTITFFGFASTLNGLRSYQWAIGTTPGGEDIQPYTTDGIVLTTKNSNDSDITGLPGNGKAQAHVGLGHGISYFSSVRAVTGSGEVLESSSDGFNVDQTPPDIRIQELGKHKFNPELRLNEYTGPLYDDDPSSITASWTVTETESAIKDIDYYVATYPFGKDVSNVTSSGVHNIAPGIVKPTLFGKPNLVHVEAVNSVGLRKTIVAPSLVTDLTDPVAGKVLCPAYLHAGGMLQCQWSGFSDPEGTIRSFNFLLGTEENRDDVFKSENISIHLDSYVVEVKHLNLTHNVKYYVTVEAVNSVGKSARAFSKPFFIDDTPPVPGVVGEYTDELIYNGLLSHEDYLQLDLKCVDYTSQLSVAWEPFVDPETTIVKYEVAVGSSPYGTQVKGYFDVGKRTTTLIGNVDLTYSRQIFVTVRGYNEAGLSSSVSSNGVFISLLNIGLPPLHPLLINDGPGESDRDFQESLTQIDATWDFSGYPCPMTRFEWAIFRIDGTEVQPYIDVGDQKYGTNSELLMANGETYYVIVRGTNILGLTVTARSDGITVQQDPLIPGHVFDGPFFGKDMNYQLSINVLSASWDGFGGEKNSPNIDHTGNDEISRSETSVQTVDYYEVAVGTDRVFSKTRHDIVPFKNVGRDTSVVFDNLDLTPLTTVYVTVRAHSVSFAHSEVSSNGIAVGHESSVSAGDITAPKFLNSLDTVDIQWSGFKSPLDMVFYYIGITDDLQAPTFDCKNLQSMLQNKAKVLNVLPLQLTNLDTYKRVTGLRLKQLESYSIIVIGYDEAGECNSTSTTFTVDDTPPSVGLIRAGPYFNMPLDYTTSKEELLIWWNGFKDDDSGIHSYRIRLLSAASCEESVQADLDTHVDWIKLNGNLTNYRFVNVSLSENQPYYVELEITNNAGSRNSTMSPPILLDNNVPSAGKVVDGVDFKFDKQFQGDTIQISGSFLHLADEKAIACPLQKSNFKDINSWTAISMIGLWNMDGIPWDIWYSPEQVASSEEEIEISLERDVRKPRILTGGYATEAHISIGGKYEVEILVASEDMNAVTAIVFWDGPENTVGGYQENEQLPEGLGDSCACCFWDSSNITCLCNCTDVIQNNNSTGFANISRIPTTLRMQDYSKTTPPPLLVDSSDVSRKPQRACGLQLKAAESNWKAVVWCRYKDDEYEPISIGIDLPFDPSKEWHTYSLLFTVTPVNAEEEQWKIDLYIDGKWKGEIDGIPQLSDSTKLILHAWNEDNFVPELVDEFFPPTATAHFRNLRMPPHHSNLCRYGDPFRGSSSPVIYYMAGVGSQPQTDDVISYQEVAKPCIPCLHPCDRLHCDIDCHADALQELAFILSNVTLPDNTPNDNITAPLYITVKSILANGESVEASSNGIVVDTSPPILDFMFYIDAEKSEYQPVTFQASKTTIKVYWSFIDDDSLITENQWSIGSQPGATDLQDFVSVGMEQLGTNSNLDGRLFHNHTYYVTLRSINGAGLTKTIECPGVTVLIDSPIPNGVNTTALFSEELPQDVYPQHSRRMNNGSQVGMSWTEADDPFVTRYEYCVGSSEDESDDIVECIPVASNSSGSVSIADGGKVIISTDTDDVKLNITDFPPSDLNKTAQDNAEDRTHFNLEPGKTVYNTIQVCNSAGLCSPVHSEATTIINDEDEITTSTDGGDINLPKEVNHTSESRRKRSFENYDLSIQTTGGLHKGGSLILGI